MSVFLAPFSEPYRAVSPRQIRTYVLCSLTRQVSLIVALIGAVGSMLQFVVLGIFPQTAFSSMAAKALGFLLRPAFLPIWLGVCLLGLLGALIASGAAGRTAVSSGRVILESMRDNPSERSLINLIQQTSEAYALLHPCFKMGGEAHCFDLATVSIHGVTLLSAAGAQGTSDVTTLKAACTRLSEQFSLPLLGRIRFVQLSNAPSSDPKPGPDWQVCQARELGRLFQRTDAIVSQQEVVQAFRALYNLALPANIPAVPVQGVLLAAGRLRAASERATPNQHRSFKVFGKILVFACLGIVTIGFGLYLLQVYDYEIAEKILTPVRTVLRSTLPSDWQDRLALGTERLVNEAHIFASMVSKTPVRLSEAIGQPGKGDLINTGIELQIIQVRHDGDREWFLVSRTGGEPGWLPGSALRMRHLVRKGTPLFERPELAAMPVGSTFCDYPVALISVWSRPTPVGSVIWSKVFFLDRTVAYIQGQL